MEMETNDHCVKNATASQLLTTIDVAIKFTTERNVILVLEVPTHQPSQHQHGNEQAIPRRSHVRCVALQHNIPISWMYIMLMPT